LQWIDSINNCRFEN